MDAQLLIMPWRKKTCQTNLNNRAVTRARRVILSSGFQKKCLLRYSLENWNFDIILFILRQDRRE